MTSSTFTAVFDACVLYPAPVRDLLIRLARAGCFRARWSADIQEEWVRNLLANCADLKREQLDRTVQLMSDVFNMLLKVGLAQNREELGRLQEHALIRPRSSLVSA